MTFFAEPFDLAMIDRLLGEEWPHFSDAAFVVLGMRRKWEAGADQLVRLFDRFREAGRDDGPLYRLFDLLGQRALDFDDSADAQQSLLDRLSPEGPRIALSARMGSIHKLDKLWREREHNKRWLEQHIALSKAMHQRAADAPLVASQHLIKSMRDADQMRKRPT